MPDTKHLLETLDSYGYPQTWCGAMESCAELHEVTCVPCLEAFLAYGVRVRDRLDVLTVEQEKAKAS